MTRAMVAQVRRFNRIVTERVGALNDHFLGQDRPLGEARLLWEIGLEGCEALGPDLAERVRGQLVHAVVGDAVGRVAHGGQAAAGEVEMAAFGYEDGIVGHSRTTLRGAAKPVPGPGDGAGCPGPRGALRAYADKAPAGAPMWW